MLGDPTAPMQADVDVRYMDYLIAKSSAWRNDPQVHDKDPARDEAQAKDQDQAKVKAKAKAKGRRGAASCNVARFGIDAASQGVDVFEMHSTGLTCRACRAARRAFCRKCSL